MSKILYGGRGCGKTAELLKRAEVLSEEGFNPVIVCVHADNANHIKERAEMMNIDISNIKFISATEYINNMNEYRRKCSSENGRILIDEVFYFLQQLTNDKNFYATLSEEETKKLFKKIYLEEE